jgi:L-aminopeptidase/D-esterase-like protein
MEFQAFLHSDLIDFSFGLLVVAETFDGILNDINGYHVKKEDVWEALDKAKSRPVAEGNVGGGTGMSLFLFKGGSGTSSRIVTIDTAAYTAGAFVQGNFSGRKDLIIAGVPVGREIIDFKPIINTKRKTDLSLYLQPTHPAAFPN